MKARLGVLRVVAFAALTAIAGLASPVGSDEDKVLPRFHQVNENLYRGAQPALRSGMKALAARGIKTVINLRGEAEHTREEEEEARAAGLKYFNVPLADLSRPKAEQMEKILSLINDRENWPVFVHCNHGKDRTGTVVAIYRITHDNWTAEQALKEAKSYGMSWVQFGMKDFIKDYYRDHKGAGATMKAALQTN